MFCEKCGNELIDEAVVCTKCGCLAKSNQPTNSKKLKTNEQCEDKSSIKFLSWTCLILAIIAIFDAICNCIVFNADLEFFWFIYDFSSLLCLGLCSVLSILLALYTLRKKLELISLIGLILSCISVLIYFILTISFYA